MEQHDVEELLAHMTQVLVVVGVSRTTYATDVDHAATLLLLDLNSGQELELEIPARAASAVEQYLEGGIDPEEPALQREPVLMDLTPEQAEIIERLTQDRVEVDGQKRETSDQTDRPGSSGSVAQF